MLMQSSSSGQGSAGRRLLQMPGQPQMPLPSPGQLPQQQQRPAAVAANPMAATQQASAATGAAAAAQGTAQQAQQVLYSKHWAHIALALKRSLEMQCFGTGITAQWPGGMPCADGIHAHTAERL